MNTFEIFFVEAVTDDLLINQISLAATADHADVGRIASQNLFQNILVVEMPSGNNHQVTVSVNNKLGSFLKESITLISIGSGNLSRLA